MCRQVELFVLMLLVGVGLSVWLVLRSTAEDGHAALEANAKVEDESEHLAGLEGRAPRPRKWAEKGKRPPPARGPYQKAAFRRVMDAWAAGESQDVIALLRAMIEDELDPNVRQAARFLLLGALQRFGPVDDAITYAADFLAHVARSRATLPADIKMEDRSLFAGTVQTDEGADPVEFPEIYGDVRATLGVTSSLFAYMYRYAGEFARVPESSRTISRELRLATYDFVCVNRLFLTRPPHADAKDHMRDFVRWYHASRDHRIKAYVAYFRRAYPDVVR